MEDPFEDDALDAMWHAMQNDIASDGDECTEFEDNYFERCLHDDDGAASIVYT